LLLRFAHAAAAAVSPQVRGREHGRSERHADPAAVNLGLVLGVGALFSVTSNLLPGRLSDRTVSRLGMRKPRIFTRAP
jgi:hypothetical protein